MANGSTPSASASDDLPTSHGTAAHAAPPPPPPPAFLGIPAEAAARMQAEFDRLSPEDKAKLERTAQEVFNKTGAPPIDPTTTTPTTATATTEPEEIDPYPVPAHLKRVAQKAFLWSQEAMDRSRYTFKKRPKWMPLVGLYLGSMTREKQDPIFMFMLERPLLVADDYNRIVEVGAGKRVVVVGSHSLRTSLQQFEGLKDRCPLLQIYPTGYQTQANGVREMSLLVLFEPSAHDPNVPQTVSIQSALGREAQAVGR